MLDAVGYYDEIAQNESEKLLELSDWMRVPLEPYEVSLERPKSLLTDQIRI
jgi:hypothetical protein